jgi:hypothetical protein
VLNCDYDPAIALAEPMIAMIAWEVQLGEQKSWV